LTDRHCCFDSTFEVGDLCLQLRKISLCSEKGVERDRLTEEPQRFRPFSVEGAPFLVDCFQARTDCIEFLLKEGTTVAHHRQVEIRNLLVALRHQLREDHAQL